MSFATAELKAQR